MTALDQGAITQARFGAIGLDAGTTRGHLVFDQIVGDTLRVGTLAHRFGMTRILTKTGHAVLGPAGIVEADIVQSAALNETMEMYDTDVADISDPSRRIFVYNSDRPIYVTRGLYCVLGGTNPVAAIKTSSAVDVSEGGVKNFALRRR